MDFLNGKIKPMYFKYLSAAFVVSVARGLVISGILIMVLPALVSAGAIWFALPIIVENLTFCVYNKRIKKRKEHCL